MLGFGTIGQFALGQISFGATSTTIFAAFATPPVDGYFVTQMIGI